MLFIIKRSLKQGLVRIRKFYAENCIYKARCFFYCSSLWIFDIKKHSLLIPTISSLWKSLNKYQIFYNNDSFTFLINPKGMPFEWANSFFLKLNRPSDPDFRYLERLQRYKGKSARDLCSRFIDLWPFN